MYTCYMYYQVYKGDSDSYGIAIDQATFFTGGRGPHGSEESVLYFPWLGWYTSQKPWELGYLPSGNLT